MQIHYISKPYTCKSKENQAVPTSATLGSLDYWSKHCSSRSKSGQTVMMPYAQLFGLSIIHQAEWLGYVRVCILRRHILTFHYLFQWCQWAREIICRDSADPPGLRTGLHAHSIEPRVAMGRKGISAPWIHEKYGCIDHPITCASLDHHIPIGSMYGIFTYIYHKNQPNVGVYVPYMDPIGIRHSCFFQFRKTYEADQVHHLWCGEMQPEIREFAGHTTWPAVVFLEHIP